MLVCNFVALQIVSLTSKAHLKRFQHLLQHLFDFIERCSRKLNDTKHWDGKRFQHLFRFCFKKTPREVWYSLLGLLG